MKSALDSRPELRDDLTIVRREERGQVQFVVKEPDAQKYFQFGESEVGLMRLMDGRRTPSEIDEAAGRELGIRPGAGRIADFAHRLKRLGLVERTPAERNLMLMERLRARRKVRAGGRVEGSLLRLRVPLGDPDALFERWVDRLHWLWSPWFVAGSVVLFLVYVAVLAVRWDAVVAGTAGMYTLSGFGLSDWILFYGIFLLVGAIHELGHGLTTKWFGGEVHQIGAMLLYFSPALFCNTNDAWTFERRSERLWVTFAGPWVQLIIAGLAGIAWMLTQPDTFVHRLAFLTVLVGGVSSVLANFNPLLPLDGYYALSDWLEVPNLRGNAFEYWQRLFKRYLLQMDVVLPDVTPRERRIYLIYGGLALLYSVVVAVLSLLWLVLVLGRFIGPWIWLIVAVVGVRALAGASGRIRQLTRAAATTWRARLLARPRVAAGVGGGVLVALLLLLAPWTFRADGRFVVESVPRVQVRTQADGLVDRVHVRQGDRVRRGEILASLWNPETEERVVALTGEVRRRRAEAARARAAGDRSRVAAAEARLRELEEELRVARARRRSLEVRAPVDGVVLSAHLEERRGERAREGDLLMEMAAPARRLARVRVPLKEAGRLAEGQQVGLKLSSRPGLTFRSRVAGVAPAAEGSTLELEASIPAGEWRPAPGMTGRAKVVTRRGTVAEALLHRLRQTLRLDLWL